MFGGNLVEGRFDAQENFGVVEEGASYHLDAKFFVFVGEQGGVLIFWLLRCCVAADWYIPLVMGVLGYGRRYVLRFLRGWWS